MSFSRMALAGAGATVLGRKINNRSTAVRLALRAVLAGAFAILAVGAAPQASAATAFAPYYVNYSVFSPYQIDSIALYQRHNDSVGLTNSFQTTPPASVITDPFAKTQPISSTFFLGVSSLMEAEAGITTLAEAASHLVLAVSTNAAGTYISNGMSFEEAFPSYQETDLIDALWLLNSPDVAQDDPGYADQMSAKNAAYDLIFSFGDTVWQEGSTVGLNEAFQRVAFSTASDAGTGFTFTTPAGVAAVPEPATWAMMILGFAGLGGMLRRRRAQTRLA